MFVIIMQTENFGVALGISVNGPDTLLPVRLQDKSGKILLQARRLSQVVKIGIPIPKRRIWATSLGDR